MHNRFHNSAVLLLISLLAMFASACGGGSSADSLQPDTPLIESASPLVENAATNLDGSPADISGLPALPEGSTAIKGSSASGDAVPAVRGNDYINAANVSKTDSGLLLQPPGFGLAWAMYGIDGLADYDVIGLDLQAGALESSAGYFLAVGNYSSRSWMISGPHSGPAKIRLPEDASFISPAGSMYFVVFSVAPPGALMQGASVILDTEEARPLRRPHPAWGLVASDNTVDNAVGVSWNAPHRGRVEHYIVLRYHHSEAATDARTDSTRWESIGRTSHTRFLDETARPNVRYFYAVVAVNTAGRSAYSNVDGGWWGRSGDAGRDSAN